MKKGKFVKFSLTLISATVLAACSSSGDDGAAARAQAQAEAQAQAQKDAQAKKAAEEAAEAARLEAEVAKSSSVGHKLVKKTKSNFVLGPGNNGESSNSSGYSVNMSDILVPTLDTIVVSQPLKLVNGQYEFDETKPAGYLEDFDFRGNTNNTIGGFWLENIYKTADGSTLNGTSRQTPHATEDAKGNQVYTKTGSRGLDRGLALVLDKDRSVYVPQDEEVFVGDKKVDAATGTIKVKSFDGVNDENVSVVDGDLRDRRNTVAEVYGARTFVAGDRETGVDAPKAQQPEIANGPLSQWNSTAKKYEAGRYEHVQYGRVTSKLHKVPEDKVKQGVNAGKFGTRVVSYGEFGQDGTEDSYFYRGNDDKKYNANLTQELAAHYVNQGKLNYQGHAVTYGFRHSAPAVVDNTNGVPNALGSSLATSPMLVSGTHVTANIDLQTKAVDGRLYDAWTSGHSNLATFNGTLNNAGEIKGTSARVAAGQDGTGTFNANLFGPKGEELGGALASDMTAADQSWGAVFGARVQNATISPTKDSVWGQKADDHNSYQKAQ